MRYLIILLLLSSLPGQAQWKSYKLSPKGDTLNRIDQQGRKQGPWVIHVDELRGERGYEEEGIFLNDVKEGAWRRFSLEGDLIAVENFRFGYKDGKNVYFNYQGEPLREENWRAIDPQNPYDTVAVYDVLDPTKVVKRMVVKVEPNSYKHGVWRYFDPQRGTVEKVEEWVMDKPKEKPKPAGSDDELAPIKDGDTAGGAEKKEEKKVVPKPREVMDFEKKNSGKKSFKVRNGSTGG